MPHPVDGWRTHNHLWRASVCGMARTMPLRRSAALGDAHRGSLCTRNCPGAELFTAHRRTPRFTGRSPSTGPAGAAGCVTTVRPDAGDTPDHRRHRPGADSAQHPAYAIEPVGRRARECGGGSSGPRRRPNAPAAADPPLPNREGRGRLMHRCVPDHAAQGGGTPRTAPLGGAAKDCPTREGTPLRGAAASGRGRP